MLKIGVGKLETGVLQRIRIIARTSLINRLVCLSETNGIRLLSLRFSDYGTGFSTLYVIRLLYVSDVCAVVDSGLYVHAESGSLGNASGRRTDRDEAGR